MCISDTELWDQLIKLSGHRKKTKSEWATVRKKLRYIILHSKTILEVDRLCATLPLFYYPCFLKGKQKEN